MAKNVTIAILLLGCLALGGLFLNAEWNAAGQRAAEWRLRATSVEVWKNACGHAAAGDRVRQKWCDLAASQTAVEAADPSDVTALATQQVVAGKH